MTPDEVRELGRCLREFAESADEDGDVGMAADMKQAAAILERLVDDRVANAVAKRYLNNQFGCDTADHAFDEFRKRVMGED